MSLDLSIGANTGYANYTGGSGGTALTFSYAVQTGDHAPGGLSVAPLVDLNGGAIVNGGAAIVPAFTAPNLSLVILNRCVYVTDYLNNRVQMFATSGA